ncbi:MAG TPA: hypothetical protein VN851_29430 [Thermoanaerobaculia bacterium]|nr:hypothetical protein [Thermoanaerobaculia bacterium]
MTLHELHRKMFKEPAGKKNYTMTPSGQIVVDLDALFQNPVTREKLIKVSQVAPPAPAAK